MRKYIILCAATLLICGSALAQKDTLNAVVQVENDYNPTVAKATKISSTPQVEIQTNSTPLDIIFSQKAHPFREFVSERNVKESMPTQQEQFPGYARLGYGTNNNADMKAIYSIAPTKRDFVEMQGSLEGYNTSIDGINKKWDSRFYSTQAEARYQHIFNPLAVEVEAGFKNSVFNYQTDNFFIGETDKQNSASYYVQTRVASRNVGPFSYKANLGYTMSTRKYSAAKKERIAESHISAGGNIEYELTNEDIRRLGADFAIDGYIYNDAMRPQAGDKYDNYSLISLSPYIDFCFDVWKVRLGINSDFTTANGAFFAIAPDCSVEGTINNNITLFASATGGRTANSLSTLEELSPYWLYTPGNAQYAMSYEIADISAGTRISLSPMSCSLLAGYAYTKDNLLPVLSADNLIGTTFTQAISRNLYVVGNIGYDYGGWLKLSADARYDHWSCTGNDEYLLYKPMIQASLKAETRLYDGLYANIGYTFTGYTKANGKRIKEMNMLNANINYRFHKQMAAYIQGNNLLNSKHQLYPGCDIQDINVLAGVTVDF